jgi:hypothetical protein
MVSIRVLNGNSGSETNTWISLSIMLSLARANRKASEENNVQLTYLFYCSNNRIVFGYIMFNREKLQYCNGKYEQYY